MKDARSDRPEPRAAFFQKGGGWILIQYVVMAAWLVLTPLGHAVERVPARLVPSVVFLALGAVSGIAGMLVLGKNRTSFPKPRSDSRLVQSGIFSLVRHPLYASLIALSLGWACLWGSGLGAALALVQAIFLDAKARREEQWLRQQFADYPAYAAKVRRLIPGVY